MAMVAGLVPFTSIDFPGLLAAVVFFQGCPLRCPFCHNPDLQENDGQGEMSWAEVISFLKSRKGKLDGVVFSGGEPLMQPDIVALAQEVKALGFKVGIHTSGVYPDKLREMVSYLDWVGLDVKAPWNKYDTLSGRSNMAAKVQESLRFLLEREIAFEARTTCDPRNLVPQDILVIAQDLKKLGVKTYALQKYRTFDADQNPPAPSAINSFFMPENLAPIQTLFPKVILR